VLGLLMITSLIITSISPYISGKFIDTIIENPIRNNIKIFVIIGASLGIAGIIISYISRIISSEFVYKLVFTLESDIISYLHKTPYELFTGSFNTPQLMHRIRSDSETIVKFWINNIFSVISNIILLIGVLTLIGFMNKSILLVMIIFIPIYMLTYITLKKPIFANNMMVKEEATIYFKNMYEQLNQIKEIKMNSSYRKSLEKMFSAFERFKSILIKNIKLIQAFKSIDLIISMIFQISVIIIGGIQIIDGSLSIGEYTILNTYFGILLNTVKYYFNFGEEYQVAKVSYYRIKELLDLELEKVGTIKIDSIENLTINKVEFMYPNGKYLFRQRNDSYIFEKGYIYCLEGENGTGKSTFINILTGVIQGISCGDIMYNDKNINEIDIVSIRKENISVLLQDFIYADESVKEFLNEYIQCINDIFRNKEVIKVFWEYEENLENILNKKMQTLSLGELQKVYLLRTILKENDVLILDEPTSSLDFASVTRLKEYLSIYKETHIVIIINHDIRLNDLFDQKILFEN